LSIVLLDAMKSYFDYDMMTELSCLS